MNDPYDLQRFVDAQAPVHDGVCAELRNGRKETHWMWFVFPQMRGLGQSAMATRYGISCKEEAAAYLAHPILGARLRECTSLANLIEGRSVDQIFGSPDNLKFRSCMVLFSSVSPATPDNAVFRQALEKYFMGGPHS